jgi:hypothetical protein
LDDPEISAIYDIADYLIIVSGHFEYPSYYAAFTSGTMLLYVNHALSGSHPAAVAVVFDFCFEVRCRRSSRRGADHTGKVSDSVPGGSTITASFICLMCTMERFRIWR